jgi:uncharacterized protein YxeA
MTMTTKTCSKCNCVKSLDDYYKNPRTKDKLTYWCKSCSIKRYKQWVKDNEVKVLDTKESKQNHNLLINDGWKHTSTLNACKFLEELYTNIPDNEILKTIKSLGK